MGIFDAYHGAHASRARTRQAAPQPAPPPQRPQERPPVARRRRRFRPLNVLAVLLVTPLLTLALALGAAFSYYSTAIPDLLALRQKDKAPVVRILARDGSVLAERGASPYVPVD